MPNVLPIVPGQQGDAVTELQRRLGAAGYLPAASIVAGTFCNRTESAVATFQRERNLPDTGVCDAPTWMALVEA
ncbi:MAG: peptidoglycan-binding protein, partial [Actinobacteria bacterium]|nr:peptidoglycan-binding protein [Actinomycetota bacterium]